MRISIVHRPAWWYAIARDFEINFCGGLWRDWPDNFQDQMKQHYDFWVDDRLEYLTFEDGHRAAWFMLKYTQS